MSSPKQLFDYTKFHIGMYTTLLAGIIGVFANESLKYAYAGMVPYITVAIVLFLVAGAAGGLVASSIPFFKTFNDFSRARMALGNSSLFRRLCALILSILPSGLDALWLRVVYSGHCGANPADPPLLIQLVREGRCA